MPLSTTLQNSTPKLSVKKTHSISKEKIFYGIHVRKSLKHQAFEKLFWKPCEDASQKTHGAQMSLPIYQGNQAPWAPLYLNVDDWGCIVRELETIVGCPFCYSFFFYLLILIIDILQIIMWELIKGNSWAGNFYIEK